MSTSSSQQVLSWTKQYMYDYFCLEKVHYLGLFSCYRSDWSFFLYSHFDLLIAINLIKQTLSAYSIDKSMSDSQCLSGF